MWINQESPKSSVSHSFLPESTTEQAPAIVTTPEPIEEFRNHTSERKAPSSRKGYLPVSRDCFLLTGSYLFGTFLSGILQAICTVQEKDMLTYYLNCWQCLFAVTDMSGLPKLFGTELWTVWGALLVLFFLGLSAAGPFLIFLFVMLYGVGSGLLLSQWMNGMDPKAFLSVLFAAGCPAAIVAGGLCLFGASAVQVSSRIQMFSFGRKEGIPRTKAGAELLTGQFVLTAAAFLPLCGLSVGMSYLAVQIVS